MVLSYDEAARLYAERRPRANTFRRLGKQMIMRQSGESFQISYGNQIIAVVHSTSKLEITGTMSKSVVKQLNRLFDIKIIRRRGVWYVSPGVPYRQGIQWPTESNSLSQSPP